MENCPPIIEVTHIAPRRGARRFAGSTDQPPITLKQAVQPSPRAQIESLLADLFQHEKDRDGQFGELGEEIEELRALNNPRGQRRFTRYDQLCEAYWTVKHRLVYRDSSALQESRDHLPESECRYFSNQ